MCSMTATLWRAGAGRNAPLGELIRPHCVEAGHRTGDSRRRPERSHRAVQPVDRHIAAISGSAGVEIDIASQQATAADGAGPASTMRGPLQAHQAVALAMGADGSSTVYKSTVQPGRLAPPITAGEVRQFRVPAAASPSLFGMLGCRRDHHVARQIPASSTVSVPTGADAAAASSQPQPLRLSNQTGTGSCEALEASPPPVKVDMPEVTLDLEAATRGLEPRTLSLTGAALPVELCLNVEGAARPSPCCCRSRRRPLRLGYRFTLTALAEVESAGAAPASLPFRHAGLRKVDHCCDSKVEKLAPLPSLMAPPGGPAPPPTTNQYPRPLHVPSPEVGRSIPASRFSSVVLPLPDVPTMATHSPWRWTCDRAGHPANLQVGSRPLEDHRADRFRRFGDRSRCAP